MKNKNNITELVFILDRSGSMSGLEGDTIGGLNAMIEKQKKQDGACYVSTVLFDDESEVLHDRVKLGDIPKMTDRDYTVRGCTALIDAIGGDFRSVTEHIKNNDTYMALADFADYRRAQALAFDLYNDKNKWNEMSLMNIASSGIFASDRSINDYANNIWQAKPLKD